MDINYNDGRRKDYKRKWDSDGKLIEKNLWQNGKFIRSLPIN